MFPPRCVVVERGLFSQQISAQSVTAAAAGMRLRTPRRRCDAFSQVRAAPGRPAHRLYPPSSVRPSVSRVSDCSDIRLSQAVSGCCEEHTAAGRSVFPAFNVSSSVELNKRNHLGSLPAPSISSVQAFGRSLWLSEDAALEGEAALPVFYPLG